jgi:hypothetical protein
MDLTKLTDAEIKRLTAHAGKAYKGASEAETHFLNSFVADMLDELHRRHKAATDAALANTSRRYATAEDSEPDADAIRNLGAPRL